MTYTPSAHHSIITAVALSLRVTKLNKQPAHCGPVRRNANDPLDVSSCTVAINTYSLQMLFNKEDGL